VQLVVQKRLTKGLPQARGDATAPARESYKSAKQVSKVKQLSMCIGCSTAPSIIKLGTITTLPQVLAHTQLVAKKQAAAKA